MSNGGNQDSSGVVREPPIEAVGVWVVQVVGVPVSWRYK
jgi:hypothetical protein